MDRQWTFFVIFCAATVSGVLTFDGISQLSLDADWWLKSVFAMTAIVITLSISLFWHYVFGIIPGLSKGTYRLRGWIIVSAGVLVILALSTYWNAISLTRNEVARLNGSAVIEVAEAKYGAALASINSYQTYFADITAFEGDTKALLQRELGGGSSGEPGTGPVSNTMGQVVDRINKLVESVNTLRNNLTALQTKATACLVDLRLAIDSGDKKNAAKSVSCINQSLAQMAGQNPAAAIKRSLSSLTSGIVIPATVRKQVQRDAIQTFLIDTQIRANKLVAAIGENGNAPAFEPISIEQPNVLKGVLIHWQALIPPIVTALAIDLLPLILLLLTVAREDDQRGRGLPRRIWTADDLLDAKLQIEKLDEKIASHRQTLDLPTYIDITPKPPVSPLTPLDDATDQPDGDPSADKDNNNDNAKGSS